MSSDRRGFNKHNTINWKSASKWQLIVYGEKKTLKIQSKREKKRSENKTNN